MSTPDFEFLFDNVDKEIDGLAIKLDSLPKHLNEGGLRAYSDISCTVRLEIDTTKLNSDGQVWVKADAKKGRAIYLCCDKGGNQPGHDSEYGRNSVWNEFTKIYK